jgi:hypothetical protein
MDDVQPDPDGVGFDLVMPFVVCRSQGGPYDDQSFAAGWSAGQMWTSLAVGQATGAVEVSPGVGSVRRDLLPQVELIAMQHGYRWVEADPPDPAADWAEAVTAEWALGTFQRGGP